MKIEAPAENQIIVELTYEDMAALDITYEEMDYSNIETRRVIWTLLDKARQTLGCDIDPSGRMLIEAVPKKAGGCVLCFTVLEDQAKPGLRVCKPTFKKDDNSFTYEFDNIDSLFSAAAGFPYAFSQVESELYTNGRQYRMVLSFQSDSRALKSFFTEYAKLCGEGNLQAEFTREHWKSLAYENALEKLNQSCAKNTKNAG